MQRSRPAECHLPNKTSCLPYGGVLAILRTMWLCSACEEDQRWTDFRWPMWPWRGPHLTVGKPVLLKKVEKSLNKSRRQRQRERHQTKELMSRTVAVHVRYISLNISLPSLHKDNVEWLSSAFFWKRERRRINFVVVSFGNQWWCYLFSLSKFWDQ